jgi:hypothetical protein
MRVAANESRGYMSQGAHYRSKTDGTTDVGAEQPYSPIAGRMPR